MNHRSTTLDHRGRHRPIIRCALGGLAVVALAALPACDSSGGGSAEVASLGTDAPSTSSDTGTADTTTTGSEVDPADAMVAYTQCMRDEGIDLPDPHIVSVDGSANQGGVVAASPVEAGDDGPSQEGPDIDSEEFQAADEVCSPILHEAAGQIEIDPEVQAEQRDRMLAHAQCMRDQGIDFPDPTFGDDGSISVGLGSDDEGGGLDPSSEKMQAAFEACRDLIGDVIVAAESADG